MAKVLNRKFKANAAGGGLIIRLGGNTNKANLKKRLVRETQIIISPFGIYIICILHSRHQMGGVVSKRVFRPKDCGDTTHGCWE